MHRGNRGGGWGHTAEGCTAAYRETDPPMWRIDTMGLRVARVPVRVKE
jgi:formylglycine-generating enzyme required for sulfatase activity